MSVVHVPGDDLMPRLVIVMGADSIALKLEDAVRVAGLILDSCDAIRNGATAAARKVLLQ